MAKEKKNPVVGMVDGYLNYQRRRERQGCFIMLGALGILVVLGIIITIVGAIFTAVEESGVVNTYGEDLAGLCNPMPVGSESSDNAPEAEGETPLRILLLKADTRQRHGWFQDLPELWQAEAQDEVALVGCIDDIEDTLETCSYQRPSADGDGSFTIRIERIQHSVEIILVNANTGRRIDSLIIVSSEPDECPDDEDVSGSGEIEGTEVELDDVAEWLEGYIFDERSR